MCPPPMIAISTSISPLLLVNGMAEGACSHLAAGSGLALFLLGLITGVGAAVAAFFACLHITRTRELSQRLEDCGEEEILPGRLEESSSPPSDASSSRPHLMPWERPEDWWRSPGEGDS